MTCPSGEKHPKAYLSSEDVEMIRQLWEEGLRGKELALKFECSEGTVRDIANYRTRCYG